MSLQINLQQTMFVPLLMCKHVVFLCVCFGHIAGGTRMALPSDQTPRELHAKHPKSYQVVMLLLWYVTLINHTRSLSKQFSQLI